jgi:hypothetical protein
LLNAAERRLSRRNDPLIDADNTSFEHALLLGHSLRAIAVCTRNANAAWVEGPEAHRSAFLIGKVRGVVPSPDHEGRYLIQFSEYAPVKVPDAWKGDRNPIKYVASLKDLGIDPSTLKWEPMPEAGERPEPVPAPAPVKPNAGVQPLTMSEAKKGLALTFGVPPDAIEITIRG